MTASLRILAGLLISGLVLASFATARAEEPAPDTPYTYEPPLPSVLKPPAPLSAPPATPSLPSATPSPSPLSPPAPAVTDLPLPQLPSPNDTSETARVMLSAFFAGDGKPIRSGLNWRVFAEKAPNTVPEIIARSNDPAPVFSLEPGTYIVHAAYGYASATKRLVMPNKGELVDKLTLSAGALKLGGAIGDTPIPVNKLSFSIYVPIGSNSEGRLVAEGVKGGVPIRLPEGTYHVVSQYGDSNAIARADLKVESGKLVEASINHRAATVTLKLVINEGGEALAGTAFSVLTPGGDVIREAIGAFPSVSLAEGDYILIARHEGNLYKQEFKVRSGFDKDVEVVAK